MDTFTTPRNGRDLPFVIALVLLLTLPIAAASVEGLAAAVAISGMCAALAIAKAANRFWTWLPATVAVLWTVLLVSHHA